MPKSKNALHIADFQRDFWKYDYVVALPSPCVTFEAVSISGTLSRLTVCNSAVSLSTATTYFLAHTLQQSLFSSSLQELVVSSHWLTTHKPINYSSYGRTGGPDFGKPSPPKEYTTCWLGSDTSLLRAFHHCLCNYARQKDKKRRHQAHQSNISQSSISLQSFFIKRIFIVQCGCS